MNILIDKDGVLYDLHKIWYDKHNDEYAWKHTIRKEDITDWDTSKACTENKCPADIFSYLQEPQIWIDGDPIAGSIETTKQWVRNGHDLVVITALSSPLSAKPSWDWLRICFPHIPNIMMVTGSIKHWAVADILIDDAIHNHKGFQGISILMDQPWNRKDKSLPRAKDWKHLEQIVNRAELYIDHYQELTPDAHELYAHKWIEQRLKSEIDEGLL